MYLHYMSKTANKWEYLLIFIWTGFRGRDTTFSGNTFTEDCKIMLILLQLVLYLLLLTYLDTVVDKGDGC